MADIRPFYGIRPRADLQDRIAALPYDVVSREDALLEAARNPLTFLLVDKPEIQFADPKAAGDQIYEKAGETLDRMLREGCLIQDPGRCYYIYELTQKGRSQTGLVACISVRDYMENRVRKHEKTLEDKEYGRIRHVEACRAHTGPIFMTYPSDEVLTGLLEEHKTFPLYDFTASDGVRHRVFAVGDVQTIGRITGLFAEKEAIYIADGHHRAAAAVKVAMGDASEEAQYFLSVLFPHDQLKILPYYRLIRDLGGYSPEGFLSAAGKYFDISAGIQEGFPGEKGSFGIYLPDGRYSFRIKEAFRYPKGIIEQLEVSLLQQYLLSRILGISDPRRDTRIEFAGGNRSPEEVFQEKGDSFQLLVTLMATDIEELMAAADAGLLMPPKSTWFEPKLRSGLLIHRFS